MFRGESGRGKWIGDRKLQTPGHHLSPVIEKENPQFEKRSVESGVTGEVQEE